MVSRSTRYSVMALSCLAGALTRHGSAGSALVIARTRRAGHKGFRVKAR